MQKSTLYLNEFGFSKRNGKISSIALQRKIGGPQFPAGPVRTFAYVREKAHIRIIITYLRERFRDRGVGGNVGSDGKEKKIKTREKEREIRIRRGYRRCEICFHIPRRRHGSNLILLRLLCHRAARRHGAVADSGRDQRSG